MRTKSLAIRGVLLTWVGRGCGLVLTFFVTPILIRELGAATYGIWSIVMALTGYYGLIDLGLGKAITKYIAQFDAQKDSRSVQQAVVTSVLTYAGLAVVVVLVAALMAWLFPILFGTKQYTAQTIAWVVILTGLKVAITMMGTVYRSILMARKRFDLVNLLGISSQIALAIVMVLIVQNGGRLIAMALAFVILEIVSQIAIYLVTKWAVRLPEFSWHASDSSMRKILFTFGSVTVLTRAAKRFGTYSGGIIIGLVIGPAAVAYYSVAQSITEKCLVLGKAINQITMPVASQLHAENDRQNLIQLIVYAPRILLSMGLFFATVLIVLGYPFIHYWITPEFAVGSYPVFCVLSLALVFKLPSNGLYAALEGMGRIMFLGRLAVLEGILIVILGVVFATLFGVVGMALSILVCQIVASGIVVPYYACRSVDYPIRRYIYEVIAPALAAAVPGLLVAILLRTFFPANDLLDALISMGTVLVVSAASAFFICLDASTRELTLQTIFVKRLPGTKTAVQQPLDQN